MTTSPSFVTLPNRGLITITGTDRDSFLQGLITNDITKLNAQPSIYACLLNAQGKFLHDFFITRNGEALFLDCEGNERTNDLARRLTLYKLRADIEITAQPQTPVYAISNHPTLQSSNLQYSDPRHPEMGHRTFTKPDLEEKPFDHWDTHRIALTIPDGSRDMLPEKSTMLECNLDKLNAIDFDKGCYIGQELTARMHYRGLTKKNLYTITGPLPEHGAPILSKHKKTIGEMRSKNGDTGIALIKNQEIENLPDNLKVIGPNHQVSQA